MGVFGLDTRVRWSEKLEGNGNDDICVISERETGQVTVWREKKINLFYLKAIHSKKNYFKYSFHLEQQIGRENS